MRRITTSAASRANGRSSDDAIRAVVSEREQKILGIIETARAKRAKFRDSRINMSHGAGGKATQSLIEGLLAPAFASDDARRDGRRRRASSRRRRAGAHHRLLRGQADALPRRLDRRARGQRHGQRPRRLRRAAAGAEPVADPRGGPGGRGAAGRGRRDRAGGEGGRRRDHHRRHEGGRARSRRRDVRVHDRHRPPRPARPAVARRAPARRPDPALGERSASTARRSCSRAESSSSTRRSSPTRARCGRWSTRCSRRSAPSCGACATPPAAASPRCSTSSRAPPRWR